MALGPDTINEPRSGEKAATACALFAALLAAANLVGFALGMPWLISLAPNLQAMSISTAALTLALCCATFADVRRAWVTTRILGGAVIALSVTVLVIHWRTGHDVVSLSVSRFFGRYNGAETSEATAFCTAVLGLGCFGRPKSQPAAASAIVVMVVSGTALLGYAYGVHDLYALSAFSTMSLRTAVALLALGTGLLLANSQAQVSEMLVAASATGRATRRQLLFLIVPAVAGFILLKLTSFDKLGPGAAMALLVVITIAPLAALILRDARALTIVDDARLEHFPIRLHRNPRQQSNSDIRPT